jgi:hypothetical protein
MWTGYLMIWRRTQLNSPTEIFPSTTISNKWTTSLVRNTRLQRMNLRTCEIFKISTIFPFIYIVWKPFVIKLVEFNKCFYFMFYASCYLVINLWDYYNKSDFNSILIGFYIEPLIEEIKLTLHFSLSSPIPSSMKEFQMWNTLVDG